MLTSAESETWAKERQREFAEHGAFEKTASAVIWTAGADGVEPKVPVDPNFLVEKIDTSGGMPLLHNHDPGAPVGRLLCAKLFETSEGQKFVAAVVGYYSNRTRVTFRDLGIDVERVFQDSPQTLPALEDDTTLLIASDPRGVERSWVQEALRDAPIEVVQRELSHNAADALQELIRVGLPYLVLVWNPFVTTIATEAGKATYEALHRWIKKLLEQLMARRNPILEIQSTQSDCLVSFLFRGKDVKNHYAAQEKLATAAAQAAHLIENLRARGVEPKTLTYEFEKDGAIWYPSYAVLRDGRIVSDRTLLIAAEQLPSGLSLGLVRSKD